MNQKSSRGCCRENEPLAEPVRIPQKKEILILIITIEIANLIV